MRFILFLLLVLSVAGPGRAEIKVVAATTDLGAFAEAAGKELVEIEVVARADRNPHRVDVRPSTMRKAASADVYLEVGLSLDLWSDAIVRGSRNRDLKVINCGTAITPLEVPQGTVDASMGDVHPEGNPHYWLDPANAVILVRFLAERFTDLDPANGDTYQANADAFAKAVESRMDAWAGRLEGASFVEYHRSWVYFAERFGVEIVGRVEPLPGIPPTAKHLIELSEQIKHSGAKLVVRDPYHSESPIEFLERETDIVGVVLPTACPEPTSASYLSHMERIIEVLVSGGSE